MSFAIVCWVRSPAQINHLHFNFTGHTGTDIRANPKRARAGEIKTVAFPQVKDTCCGGDDDGPDPAQCQIACGKFLANTPSINRHAAAVDQEILDLCSEVGARGARADALLPHRRRCSRNATAARPLNGHKCKYDNDNTTGGTETRDDALLYVWSAT